MVDVTDIAREKLVDYMAQNNLNSPLRIMLMQGGCSGPALGIGLDEQKDGDIVTTKEGLTFLIDRELLAECGNVSVDFIDNGNRSGFIITTSKPLAGVGNGCNSGSCGSSGCGC